MKNSKDMSIPFIMGVIFREVIDGEISRDLSDEAISKRGGILGDITLDVVLPFINALKTQL